MPEIEHYKNLVLGSGESGKYIAWTLAKAGERTAVVERGLIGGSCPNIACLPSKNIIHSAKVASLLRRAAEFGVEAGPFKISMEGVRSRKRQMVNGLIQVHLTNYEKNGAELILGEGRITHPTMAEALPTPTNTVQQFVATPSAQGKQGPMGEGH